MNWFLRWFTQVSFSTFMNYFAGYFCLYIYIYDLFIKFSFDWPLNRSAIQIIVSCAFLKFTILCVFWEIIK